MPASPPAFVIVNPASGGGSGERLWPKTRDTLHRHIDFDFALSQRPGHIFALAKEAHERGCRRLVCVGGDGTLHEAVNGLLSVETGGPLPELGVVPCGTGSDFARSLGIPHRIEEACERLAAPRTTISDVGMVSYSMEDGSLEQRYFVNAAGLGYDAEVVSRRNGFARYARGTIPYLVSLGVTLLTYRNQDVTVTVDESREIRRVNSVVLAIGRYFGGGMKIAPNAVLDDGHLDVITIGDAGRLELLWNLPGVYSGRHLRNPKVRHERARLVRIESSQRVLIQADGELLGMAPAQFHIIPRILTFLC